MTNEEHAKMLLHRIGAMPYFDEQAIQKMIVDEFAIIKNEAAIELETVKRERDELRIELQTTAKHKLLDGSFCWCDKVNFQFNPEYGHTASCYAHRVALKAGKA